MQSEFGDQTGKLPVELGHHANMSEVTLNEKPTGCACSRCPTLQVSTPSMPKKPLHYYLLRGFVALMLVATIVFMGVLAVKPQSNTSVDSLPLVARGLEEADITGRFAYQSLHKSKNGKPQKPDQVVPFIELAADGKTVTARVSHTHPNNVPPRLTRDVEADKTTVSSASHTHHPPGPVIHNAADLEDILFDVGRTKEARALTGDQIHTDFETRTVAYSTDDDGMVLYRPSILEKLHTHRAGAPVPLVPDINPDMADGDKAKVVNRELPGTIKMTTTFPPHIHNKGANSEAAPTAAPAQVNSEAQSKETGVPTEQSTSARVAKVAPIALSSNKLNDIHNGGNASHGDSSYTHNHTHLSVGHDDGDGDVPHFNATTITKAPRSEVTMSIIADAFFDVTQTVTHVSGSTWRQVTTPFVPAPPIPTNQIVGPIVTVFEPVINTTYELIPMQGDDPKDTYSIYWNPIATGAPTRADHISIMSSWKANGGTYPAMPTRYDIVWDHRTNTTWNKTVEGTWDNWIDVYVSITTQYPAPAKTPVPDIPQWPGQPDYSENPFFTVEPGPNWVGPSTSSTVPTGHAHGEHEGPETLSNGQPIVFPSPTEGSVPVKKSVQPVKNVDQHYPVPFFPKGAENYDVWSEWVGYCGVIKHITPKGESHLPLKPFGDLHKLGGDYVQSMCFRGINYYLHIDNESKAGRYWLTSLIQNRNISEVGYAGVLPDWSAYPNPVGENIHDVLQPEWISDCLVLFHHAGSSAWGGDLMLNTRKEFDAHGRRFATSNKDLVQSPRKCEKINMLLHVEEYHNMDGFQIGDWWITPMDKEPFYVGRTRAGDS
ncbi:hypothetical protein TWF281_001052 [Arthrobotrys megalospora]